MNTRYKFSQSCLLMLGLALLFAWAHFRRERSTAPVSRSAAEAVQ